MRRSLDAGGIPLDPAWRRARRTKPQVVMLCDISGSVAEFAHFTLMLLHAMRAELAGLRAFVFVDGVAEVTRVIEEAEVTLDPRLLVTVPGVVAGDGHSDYGRALDSFVERFDAAVGAGTTVLVAGDARTNLRGPGSRACGSSAIDAVGCTGSTRSRRAGGTTRTRRRPNTASCVTVCSRSATWLSSPPRWPRSSDDLGMCW